MAAWTWQKYAVFVSFSSGTTKFRKILCEHGNATKMGKFHGSAQNSTFRGKLSSLLLTFLFQCLSYTCDTFVVQWWKQNQNVKIKIKSIWSKPRPNQLSTAKLQTRTIWLVLIDMSTYVTEKLFCCNTHVCYQKIAWCKKYIKSDDL